MIALILVEAILFGVFLAADLVSKHFVMPFLEGLADKKYVLIDKVITLRPAYNEGAGFSILSGQKGWLIAITVVGLALVLGFAVYAHLRMDTKRKSTKFLLVILCMMFAGGVGNLVDRIYFGYVRDFIDYTVVETLFHRSFAICNVADIWLTVGMILLVVYIIFFWRDANLKPKADVQQDSFVVAEAERLLSMDIERTIDQTQVVLKSIDEAGTVVPKDAASPPDSAQAQQEDGVIEDGIDRGPKEENIPEEVDAPDDKASVE